MVCVVVVEWWSLNHPITIFDKICLYCISLFFIDTLDEVLQFPRYTVPGVLSSIISSRITIQSTSGFFLGIFADFISRGAAMSGYGSSFLSMINWPKLAPRTKFYKCQNMIKDRNDIGTRPPLHSTNQTWNCQFMKNWRYHRTNGQNWKKDPKFHRHKRWTRLQHPRSWRTRRQHCLSPDKPQHLRLVSPSPVFTQHRCHTPVWAQVSVS